MSTLRRIKSTFVGLAVLCSLLLALPAVAQDDPRSLSRAALAATRSSHFDPPSQDVFVADDGPGLDTGCTFNTSSNHPLIIDVLIDQAVGEVDANGFLVDPEALVAKGVIPAKVEVIMPAYDIDIFGAPPPENDEVLLNGERLGILTGDDGSWKLSSFSVPVGKIKFPAPAASGSPVPVANRIQINIDTLSTGRWCTAIDWVALKIPVKLNAAFKLEPTVSNGIRVRDESSDATIDVIYQQSFDKDCNVKTDIGAYDDYPFSGPAIPGSARLHASVKWCPSNDHLKTKVKVDWKIAGTSLKGVSTWVGNAGDVNLTLPKTVGSYDVELTFTVDGKKYPAIQRKLFVTREKPKTPKPPRLGWYEKATAWAKGKRDEGPILTALLGGVYSFGQAKWRYGYEFIPGVDRCKWEELIADPISCDYSDCFVFSEVFENMSATLGVGGLSPKRPEGTHRQGFLTNGAPSLDPAFPGNARRIGSSTYDRYDFSAHSLRLKGSKYYDATFNGIYSSETAFITANRTGSISTDADGPYWVTDEGWNIYELPSSVYDSWGDLRYKPPAPVTPVTAPAVEGFVLQTSATPDIEITGNATFGLLDDDLDGIAEALTTDVEVRLNATGQYTIRGTLQKSGQLVANRPAWESMLPVRATLDEISGTYTVTLQFSGEQIYRSGVDGPYELELVGISDGGATTATLATPAHAHTLFGENAARFIGVSEAAVDTTGDGKIEFIDLTLGLDVRLPAELRLQGDLAKDGQTVADAGTTQSLDAGARQVTLRFDGRDIRRSGLDGPYEGSVNLIDADGRTIDGIRFTTHPYSAGSFSSTLVPQGPFSDSGVDADGNGLYDLLRIVFGAGIERAGSYRLTGVLRGADTESAVYVDSLLTVPAGPASIQLEFPGPEINALGLDGPYTVDVLVRDPSTLEELDAVRLPQATAAYLSTQFDPFGSSNLPIALTGSSTDSGVDTNGNGRYDELHVDVEVSLARADFYEWSARLVDRNGTEIGFHTRRQALAAGVTNIHFVFDGETIGRNGVDGPYFVKSLLIFGGSGANLVRVDVAATRPYPVTEFEGARDVQPPQIAVAAGPTVLWPANHKHKTVAVTDLVLQVTDDRDPNVSLDDVVILRVTSDEPDDALGNGDGSTVNDIVLGAGCRSVELRAERAGGGNGRVYTIHLAVADASGNVGTASHTVTVPHAAGGSAVDDGPAHTVEGCTP